MFNIFNLFLVLLFCWLAFALSAGVLSWNYLFLGIIAALIVSLICRKINLINKNTNFKFLYLGFYQHFIKLFLGSFFKIFTILISNILKSDNQPVLYILPIKKQFSSDLAIFISTISLMPGLFCTAIKDDEIMIHALDKKYFKINKINKIYHKLKNINDDLLV